MFKQNKVVVFVVLLAVYSALSAGEVENSSLVAEISKTQKEGDKKPNGTIGPTLASTFPVIDDYMLHLGIGLIYEQVRMSNTVLCVRRDRTAAPGLNPLLTTDVDPYQTMWMLRQNFDMEPGVRAEFGIDSRFDDWRLNATFEWLSPSSVYAPGNLTGNNGATYIPTGTVSIYYPDETQQIDFGKVNANMYIDYYMLDVTLSRGSYVSERFSFEPYLGLHSTWLYFDTLEAYANDLNTAGSTLPSGTSWARRTFSSFWGVGPMFGLNGNYHMGSGFSVFFCGDLSVLLAETNITWYYGFLSRLEEGVTIPGEERVRDINDLLTIYMRGILGFQYDRILSAYDRHIRIRAGFDSRMYLDPYPVVRLEAEGAISGSEELTSGPSIEESGDFGMVGAIIDFAIDF